MFAPGVTTMMLLPAESTRMVATPTERRVSVCVKKESERGKMRSMQRDVTIELKKKASAVKKAPNQAKPGKTG